MRLLTNARIRCALAVLLLAPAAAVAQGAAPNRPSATKPATPAGTPVSYYRDIVPLFRTTCIGCHNGDAAAGGLNLTSYAAAIKGGRGGALFAPNKGAESRLVRYLTGSLKPQMPPGGPLKAAEIDHVRQWIDAGAKVDTPSEPDRRTTVTTTTRSSAPGGPRVALRPAGAAFQLVRPAPVTSLAFSPDGKTLAVGTYREVQFYETESRRRIGRWPGHADTVRSLCYSRNGKLLAAGGGASGALGEIRIWDVAAGREIAAFGDQTDSINAVSFNPDATRIVSASSDKSIKTWDVATGKAIGLGRDHSDAVWGVAWSPDGKYLASCGADRSVKIWDAAAMKRLYSMGGHEDVVFSVEFSADSKSVLTASADRTARVWNVGPEGGGVAQTLAGHGGQVTSASFGPEGRKITGAGDKLVRLWGGGADNYRTLSDAKDWIYAVRFRMDGKLAAAGSFDGSIYLWNPTDGKMIDQFTTGPTSTTVKAP